MIIINGKLIKGKSKPDKTDYDSTIDEISYDGKLSRLYAKHSHEMIQPYNAEGTPNQDFIDYYPEQAKEYGFIKEEYAE